MEHAESLSQNLKRRRKIRTQFRAIVRTIIMNKVWISMQDEQPISPNVKKNLAIITRRQRQTGILTVAEKSLIRKPMAQRTIAERKQLLTLVSTMKCFSKYSPKIRARIAPHLIFIYVQANRTLIKEGDTPSNVYYILNGEIVVTTLVYDQVKNEMVPKPAHIAGPGDTLGESSFVENRPRSSTFKVTKDVEALCLEGEIYEEYILSSVRMQWEKKKEALLSFDYFNNWERQQFNYACENGSIKQYEPMETIYHEDKGILNHVYFILSGECMILQCLKMMSRTVKNQKQYQLCEADTGSELGKRYNKSQVSQLHLLRRLNESSKISQVNIANKHKLHFRESYRKPTSSFLDVRSKADEDWQLENHFTDVGSLRYGAIFGLGESMEHRAIMARTMVQCLLLPRFWLLEKTQNPGNMWQRMKFHLDATIPSREYLFKDFLSTQKWQTFKKNLVKSSLEQNRVGNPTKSEDIPVICRIIEPNFDE